MMGDCGALFSKMKMRFEDNIISRRNALSESSIMWVLVALEFHFVQKFDNTGSLLQMTFTRWFWRFCASKKGCVPYNSFQILEWRGWDKNQKWIGSSKGEILSLRSQKTMCAWRKDLSSIKFDTANLFFTMSKTEVSEY